MRNGRPKKSSEPQDHDPLAPPELPGISLTAVPLSRGPSSAVYRGWDQVHHYDVIVKVLHTAGDPVTADRFRREAAVMAQLRHPNIVALYRFHDGEPSALVMEYVAGQTLDARIAADGRLEPAAAVRIIEEIAAALDCIHAENVVHRDVKPSNILLAKSGPARLTDFGVAHIDTSAPLTVRGDMLGTIEYASPEQVRGTEVPDSRSDVYSLAAVAYIALTGTPPFPAADNSMQSQLSVMHQQVFAEPPPLHRYRDDLAPGIDAAVRRGLAKDPDARYPSAGQFASALRSAIVAASGTPERVAMAATSRRTTAAAIWPAALAGAAVLAGSAVVLWNSEHPAPVPVRPQEIASRTVPAAPPVMPPLGISSKPTSERLPAQAEQAARNILPKAALKVAANAAPKAAHLNRAKRGPKAPPSPAARPSLIADRPKPRPRPLLVAQAAADTRRPLPAKLLRREPMESPGVAWLSVFASQDSSLLRRGAVASAVPARFVTVDGHPVPALAAGGWAALPSGKHLISYVPAEQSGFGPSPGLWVTLAPGAHVSRQVLLPLSLTARVHKATVLAAEAPAAHGSSSVSAPPPTVAAIPPAAASPAVGWYTVSGWIARDPAAAKPTLVRTSAQWVKVDGHPVLSLALGQWAELPAGKHTITFQPTVHVGVGVKTWDINLAPQAHLDQQIPLPPLSTE